VFRSHAWWSDDHDTHTAPMQALIALLLVLLLSTLGFVGGAALGARFIVDRTGLAGGATVFLWALGGTIAAALTGIVIVRRASYPRQRAICIAVAGTLGQADSMSPSPPVSAARPIAAAPQINDRTNGQINGRTSTAQAADLPMGLGIARVVISPTGTLAFYGEPAPGQGPGDYTAVDVVRFAPADPGVAIAEAPPWLVPEHLKMDYELFDLRVLLLTPQWVEVIGNMSNGQTWWVDRSQIRFIAWPELLVSAAAVTPIGETTVRARPLDTSPHPGDDIVAARCRRGARRLAAGDHQPSRRPDAARGVAALATG